MNTTQPFSFIVTAEHASASLPESLEKTLRTFLNTCETHQVFDSGSLAIAEELANKLKCPLVVGTHSRLAVDLNRSIGNPFQFCPIVYDLSETQKAQLLNELFLPFREEATQLIEGAIGEAQAVVHLSIHSFTKTWEGRKRSVDLGILFDDQRPIETKFCKALIKLLKIVLPELNIQANEPYHGREDGHTTALRKQYPHNRYIGIELEFSQDLDLDLDKESYASIISTALKGLIR